MPNIVITIKSAICGKLFHGNYKLKIHVNVVHVDILSKTKSSFKKHMIKEHEHITHCHHHKKCNMWKTISWQLQAEEPCECFAC